MSVTPKAPIPTPPGFDALSKAEQVRYLQALWDRISGSHCGRETHLRLAEDRLKRYREDPQRGHSAFEVFNRFADDK